MIRQQLTNTEDIRRVRKKAPCTRPEILMIQKQFLEDEIFSETIFTGELLVIKFSMCSLCHYYVFLKFDDLTLIDIFCYLHAVQWRHDIRFWLYICYIAPETYV